MNLWVGKIHVLATAIVGVQLVVWTATGFAFTLFDFSVVRGVNDRAPPPALDLASVRLGPEDAVLRSRAARPGTEPVRAIRLKPLDLRAVYEVTFADGTREALVAASDGQPVVIDLETATRIATRAYSGRAHARAVERRNEDERSTFVVHLDDPRATDVVVDAATGEVTSWKNDHWRAFDTLWSLHVFGYIDRRSPAQWPLRVVALLAAVATCSGAALLVGRVWRRVRRQRRASSMLAARAHGTTATKAA